MRCPTCGNTFEAACAPSEPPVGTWVRDARGAVSVRIVDSDGRDGWAPALTGFYAFARWNAMWVAHGPLVPCGPYGTELSDA